MEVTMIPAPWRLASSVSHLDDENGTIMGRLLTEEASRQGAVSYTHLDVYKRQGIDTLLFL